MQRLARPAHTDNSAKPEQLQMAGNAQKTALKLATAHLRGRMRRTFLTNLALLLVLNLLVKPFYILGIDAGVQVAVGTEEYGLYAALLSLSFLLNILLDAGITNFNTRHIAQHTQLIGKYFSGMVGVRAVLALFYAGVTLVAGFALGYEGRQLELLGWLVVNQVLASTILYLRSNIAGAQKYRQDSLLSVADRVLLIGGVGWLLWFSGMPFQIEWFIWAQTIAYSITMLIALMMVLRLSGRVKLQWKPVFNLLVLRQSFPYALLILLMTFYYRTDMLMLERLAGEKEAGIYAQGFRFFEALNMLGFLVAGLLLPMYSRMLKAKESVNDLTATALRLVVAGSIAVALFGSWYSKDIMELRYTEHTDRSGAAFAVLMWCFVAVTLTYIFGTLLTAAGELKKLNWMAASGAGLNIVLNLILVPRFASEGAAWASLAAQWTTAVVQIWIACRLFGLKEVYGVILRLLPYLAGLVIFLFTMDFFEASLLYMAIFYFLFSLLWAFLTGLLGRKYLLNAFQG